MLEIGGRLPKTLVMKFGGTSVGSAQAMRQAAAIVKQQAADWPRLVVVASAMSGVTNLLLEAAQQAASGKTGPALAAESHLRRQHLTALHELVDDSELSASIETKIEALLMGFTNLCLAISVLGEATPRAMDAVASLGERMSVHILAGALKSSGVRAEAVEATELIVTDAVFQDARPNLEATIPKTRQRLEGLLSQGSVPIVTGFIAATPDGITTTLGRGGSDYSAAILGAALPADEVWIWTDVDGVMSADPRLVPGAHTIESLSYREIAELAYFGAKVVHPKTIRPVIERGIGLRVCNTFNPANRGTRLVPDRIANGCPAIHNGPFKAVTAIQRQTLITLEGRGMLGVSGVAARTFQAVARTGTSVSLISQASSEQSICFSTTLEAGLLVLRALEAEFAPELARCDIDRVWASEEVVIVTIVGAGMQHTPGIAGKVFGALGDCGVNVIAIAQGSSEVSISLVVKASDAEAAVRALHGLIEA